MNILLVTSFFPPNRTAGTEMRTLGYASGLRGLGHHVQVVCAGDWEIGRNYWNGYQDEIYQGIPVRRVNLNWSLAPDPNRYLTENPIIQAYFEQWLDEWKPDIVHITSCITLSASVIGVIKAKNIPVVLTLTDFWFICPKINLVRWDKSNCNGRTSSGECLKCLMWETKAYLGLSAISKEANTVKILTWLSKQPALSRNRGFRGMALDMDHRKEYLSKVIEIVDCLSAPSSHLAKVFKDNGVAKPIRVIYSGHDLSWLDSMPKKVRASQIRFGYIGQIIPVKGVDLLISAFQLAQLGDRAKLSVYGNLDADPGYVAKLKAMSQNWEDRINFYGHVPRSQLGEIFAEIDILVVPSQWAENNPRVIQEAFASKTPVIASHVSGISEFVKHEVNGLLFERGDVTDLARLLQHIVSDPGLLDHLRSHVPRVKTMAEEVHELELVYKEFVTRYLRDSTKGGQIIR